MGLIKCPDCERDVSTLAKACPGCGRPMLDAPNKIQLESKANSNSEQLNPGEQMTGSQKSAVWGVIIGAILTVALYFWMPQFSWWFYFFAFLVSASSGFSTSLKLKAHSRLADRE